MDTQATCSSPVQTPFCDKYLGGYSNVVGKLAGVLRAARERAKMSQRQLDKFCGFGEGAQEELPIPKSAVLERQPEKMNSFVFSLASLPLGLKADTVIVREILRRRLTPAERGDLAEFMCKNDLGIQYAAGGEGQAAISLRDQAEVFLTLRVLDEIDAVSRSKNMRGRSDT